ncbi:hypothetical protein BJX61DRAFT_134081 [Aspergillus egyptiacus]|nr:hypothetical protein BJX61DRAFT_134081 [Aspergillus egyptiacus]
MVQDQLLSRSTSLLEELPAEILQEIFLRCLEINLPRASIYIARALSCPAIYTWLIRLAFTRYEGGDRSGFFEACHFLPPQNVVGHLSEQERMDLRNIILGCRWCTLPLIRKCQVQFVRHVLHYNSLKFAFDPEDWRHVDGIERRLDDLGSYNTAADGQPGDSDLVLHASPLKSGPDEKVRFRVAVYFNLGTVHVHSLVNDQIKTRMYCELPSCDGSYVPEKLLCPPWTESKLEFLQLLSTKACLDKDPSCPRAVRILRQLIRDRDFATFARLLRFHVRLECYNGTVRWPTPDVVFRAALKHARGDDDPFIRLLVEERWDDIRPDDLRLKEKLLTKVRA